MLIVCVWLLVVAIVLGWSSSHVVCVCVAIDFVKAVVLLAEKDVAAACAYDTGPAAFFGSHSLRASGKEISFSVFILTISLFHPGWTLFGARWMFPFAVSA